MPNPTQVSHSDQSCPACICLYFFLSPNQSTPPYRNKKPSFEGFNGYRYTVYLTPRYTYCIAFFSIVLSFKGYCVPSGNPYFRLTPCKMNEELVLTVLTFHIVKFINIPLLEFGNPYLFRVDFLLVFLNIHAELLNRGVQPLT